MTELTTEVMEDTVVEATEEIVEVTEEEATPVEDMTPFELLAFMVEASDECTHVLTKLTDKAYSTKSLLNKEVTSARAMIISLRRNLKKVGDALLDSKSDALGACAAVATKEKAKTLDERIAELVAQRDAIAAE